MRKTVCLLLALLLLLSGCGTGAAHEAGVLLPWPEEPVSLFVSSDLHWHEPGKLRADSLITQMAYMEEIIDTLLDETVRAEPEGLVLCGDLTNGGSEAEHRAMAGKLELVRKQGVPVFVTMGNHDMDKSLAPALLKEIYRPFGYEGALSEDEESMSYLAPVSEELWILSLDCNVYGEKESGVAGMISPSTLDWVKTCLERAEKAGVMVLPFSHHNLVVHNMRGEGRNYNIDGGDALAELLMDYGVPIYLSGHRHNSFIATAEKDGRRIDELVSDMPESYPHRYTTVTFRAGGTVDYAVPNLDMNGWAHRAGRTEADLVDFQSYTEKIMARKRRESGVASLKSLDLPEALLSQMVDYYVDFHENYQNRRLHLERERLLKEPGYRLWGKYAGETVYGRWIPWLLQNQYHDAPRQTLGPYR